jgi:hypothetical protein
VGFRSPDAQDVVVAAVVVVDEIQECSVIKIKKKLYFYFFFILINTHIFRLMFLNHYLPDEDVVVVVVEVDADEQAAVERIAVQLEERNAD